MCICNEFFRAYNQGSIYVEVRAFDNPKTILDCLGADDPLCKEVIEVLLSHREEDTLVDFKEAFHPLEEKDWLEITKDVLAFANTFGGYIVFGVRDKTFDVVGLEADVVDFLTDTNKVLQKLNRFQEPFFTGVRTKGFKLGDETVVVLFIPASLRHSHIFHKDGKYKYPSGKEAFSFREGTSYVRYSAGNHLVNSRDLDDIFERRLNSFRDSLMEKIAKVVDAPSDSSIHVVSSHDETDKAQSFVLTNRADAVPVKGISFSISPETDEEKIYSWVAVSHSDSTAIPTQVFIWDTYLKRDSIEIPKEIRLEVAKFSTIVGCPAFYWLQDLPGEEIKRMLTEVASRDIDMLKVSYQLGINAFLGKAFFRKIAERFRKYEGRIQREHLSYPESGPRSLISGALVEAERKAFKGTDQEFRVHLISELNQLVAKAVACGNGALDPIAVSRIRAYDCFLYAQDDRYPGEAW